MTNRGEDNAYKRRDRQPDYGPLVEIFTLEDKSKVELNIKYAEWRKVEPRLDEGIDEFVRNTYRVNERNQ